MMKEVFFYSPWWYKTTFEDRYTGRQTPKYIRIPYTIKVHTKDKSGV